MSKSEEYGMEIFQRSDEYKAALAELRKKNGVQTRAMKRLSGGNILHKRRTSKNAKTSVEGSPPTGTGG